MKRLLLLLLLFPLVASAGVLKSSTSTTSLDLTCSGCVGSTDLDLAMAPTWTGLHAFTLRTAYGAGATSGTASSTYYGAIEPLLFDSQKTATDFTNALTGTFLKVIANPSANTANAIFAVQGHAETLQANTRDIGGLISGQYISVHRGTGTLAGQSGISVRAVHDGSGNVTGRSAIEAAAFSLTGATGDLVTQEGLYIYSGTNAAGSTVGTDRTIYIDSPYSTGAMTTHVGLDIANQAFGTTNRSIRVLGTAIVEIDPVLQADGGINAPNYISQAADPADAGVVRLGNTEIIGWEADAAGTDVTLAVNSSEQVVITGTGLLSPLYSTTTRCTDSAGDAACSAAPAGSVVVDATDTTTVVSTTAVTANSQIFLQVDASLGTLLSVTCNTQSAGVFDPRVTARTAATSFTITLDAGPTTNPLCISYFIVN